MASAAGSVLRRGWARLSRRTARRSVSSRRVEGRDPPVHFKARTTTATTVAYDSTAEDQRDVEEAMPSSFVNDRTTIDPETLPNRKNFVNRGMDRLRRSFRKSFHRGKTNRLTSNAADGSTTNVESPPMPSSSNAKHSFQLDEAAVRNGTCHFPVKYLGSCEVFESRGMNVCEGALRHLRDKKRTVKAILYVSGDSLRLVDQEQSRGLILDQTVEKVSFCAPDRRNDKGFAYICRDGATRRWMCHGFQAIKDNGERLSHAVGCSFAVCLEKKKKREAEIEVFAAAKTLADEIQADRNGLSRNNQAYNSFRRQLSISERRQDPQKAIMVEPLPVARPPAATLLIDMSPDAEATHPAFDNSALNDSCFKRQPTSFHSTDSDQPALRRFQSLRTDLKNQPSGSNLKTLYNEPIYEGEESWPGSKESPHFDNASFSTHTPRNGVDAGLRLNGSNKENGVVTTDGLKSPASNQTDEWLEKAMRSTLTLNGHQSVRADPVVPTFPPLTGTSTTAFPIKTQSNELPSPPIANGHAATKSPEDLSALQAQTKQSIEYQLLEETDVPSSPPNGQMSSVDVFGQPTFNPNVSPAVKSNGPKVSGLQFSDLAAVHRPKKLIENSQEVDPFDVRWSAQILQSARSTARSTPTSTSSHRNPFSNESAPVNV